MNSIAVIHASQLVTLAGPKRPRVGAEMTELAIIPDGGMLIRDGKIELVGPSAEIEKKSRAVRRLSMPAFALCCQDLSMHTRIWFLPEIGLTILSGARAAKRYEQISKAGRRDLVNGRKNARGQRAKIFSCRQRNTQNGFYAAERQLSRQNPATG